MPSQISGQAKKPSKKQQQQAKNKKPALVKRVEQIGKAIAGMNPFD